ncbi:MAG: hypothetical protein WA765_04760 [Candidatus Acidiferrum sp.]
MKNFWSEDMIRSIITAFCLFGALCLTGTFAVAQSGTAQDSCDAVHAAYKKTFDTQSQMSKKNSGAVDVTNALGAITADGSNRESCKYLRDDTLNGEAVGVYSEVMKSRLGIADGKLWISKTKGLVLQQEVEVDMGAKGKGKQTIVFDYKKK